MIAVDEQVERMAALYGEPAHAERVLPHSVEAEQAVLGGLMLANEAMAQIGDWLASEDFYRREHQTIYAAMLAMAERKVPFDVVTIADALESAEVDPAYVIELASTTPSAANIVAYAEIVRDKANLRRVIEIGTGMADAGFQPDGRSSAEIVGEAQRSIAELRGDKRAGGFVTAKQAGAMWYAEFERRYGGDTSNSGLRTPWSGFNRLVGGMMAGDLVIVAGRPSMGKSAWAVNVATSACLRGERVLFFNLEMTAASIFNRCVSSVGNVPLAWLKDPLGFNGPDSELYSDRVTMAVRDINGSPLLIDDTAGLTMPQIVARARREHMRGKIGAVIVDHLHLIPLPGKTRETVEIGHITAALKKLAKELECPVILLSQLNRSLEARTNKRPTMADLRESGNIEQDADLIVLLYRDDYYSEREGRTSPLAGFVEMIIAKQREGETGTAWGRNALAFGRIDDYEGPAPQIHASYQNGRAAVGMD